MSQLVARILLAILMVPCATVVYTLVLVGYLEWGSRRDINGFMFGTLAAWAFIVIWWLLLWGRDVRWQSWRVIATALAFPLSVAVGAVPGLLGAQIVQDDFGMFIGGMTAVFVWLVLTVLIWRETTAERQARHRVGSSGRRSLRCPACDYDMAGLDRSVCPECGARYTVDELVGVQLEAAGGQLEDGAA